MLYWGFDLGDGESSIARVDSGRGLPEIVEIDGKKVIITAWAVMRNGEVRVGENAARSASSAIRSAARFKSRFLDPTQDSSGLIRDFAAKILESLRKSGDLKGGEKSNSFYIGCPAGWDREARAYYQTIFENLGVPAAQVISESRAVLVGAIQSNYLRDYVDLNTKSVLVIDMGSSTTDFAFVNKGKEHEIHTGGEVALGGGIMDELLLEACIAASPHAQALREIFADCDSWRVDCELHARALKERYFSHDADYWEQRRCLESLLITYDEPLVFDLFMDAQTALRLTEKPCEQLRGRSFHEAFCASLRVVKDSIGEAQPELLFLTGGVSRMRAVSDWCREVFPDILIYSDSEPEFSVARGLAWCGRVDNELRQFRDEVDRLIHSSVIEDIVSDLLPDLYQTLLDKLLDPIIDNAVKPVLIDWREGRIETIEKIGPALQEKIRIYLYSAEAKALLLEPVREWLRQVSERVDRHTSVICRKYHVPDRSLGLSSQLSANDFQYILGRINTTDMFPGQTFTGAAVFVESILSVLIGMLCGGSGVVLLMEGPLGIAVGAITSGVLFVVAHALGKKAVDQKIMTADLPLFVRRMAFAKPIPKIEMPGFSLPNPLKKVKPNDTADQSPSQTEGQGKEKTAAKLQLLPHVVLADDNAVSERRIRAIRNKVKASYEERLRDKNNVDLIALNRKLCLEISDQIEKRLKQLSEQVEIPL